jgi:hypothetical protein
MATAISAAQVKQLRDQTGAGMMECKNALTEANGDFEEANTILRKRGLATAAKKAGRATSEGLIANRLAAVFTCPRVIAVIVWAAIILAAIILPVIILAVTTIAAAPRAVGILAARETVVVPSVIALGGPSAVDLIGLRRIQDDAVEPFADRHAGTACSFTRGFTRLRPHPVHLPRQTSFHAHIRPIEG